MAYFGGEGFDPTKGGSLVGRWTLGYRRNSDEPVWGFDNILVGDTVYGPPKSLMHTVPRGMSEDEWERKVREGLAQAEIIGSARVIDGQGQIVFAHGVKNGERIAHPSCARFHASMLDTFLSPTGQSSPAPEK